MGIKDYTPGIELGAGLTPAGNRTIALMQACDILVGEHDKRLDTVLDELRELSGGGGGLPLPLPEAVSTEAEMNSILAKATEANIGAIYKYMGEPSDTYEYGALYIIAHEIPDGDEVSY